MLGFAVFAQAQAERCVDVQFLPRDQVEYHFKSFYLMVHLFIHSHRLFAGTVVTQRVIVNPHIDFCYDCDKRPSYGCDVGRF